MLTSAALLAALHPLTIIDCEPWKLEKYINIQLTAHFDVLGDLQQLHLCRHVAHGSHAISQIFVAEEAILIGVKFLESI